MKVTSATTAEPSNTPTIMLMIRGERRREEEREEREKAIQEPHSGRMGRGLISITSIGVLSPLFSRRVKVVIMGQFSIYKCRFDTNST